MGAQPRKSVATPVALPWPFTLHLTETFLVQPHFQAESASVTAQALHLICRLEALNRLGLLVGLFSDPPLPPSTTTCVQ